MHWVVTGRRYLRVLVPLVGLVLLLLVTGAPGAIAGLQAAPEGAVFVLEPGSTPVSVSFPQTQAQLNAFYVGKGNISDGHKEVIEAQLFAEDEIMAGDYIAARRRLDAIFAKYPIENSDAWSGLWDPAGVWAGGNNPTAYGGLRMLEEVLTVALNDPPATSTPWRITVVMPRCSTGTQPANQEMSAVKPVNGQLSQQQLANNYRVQRQWFKTFQLYVWAITGGQRHVELEFYHPDECIELQPGGTPGNPGIGIANRDAYMAGLSREVHDRSDMFTILSPFPPDAIEDLRTFGGTGWIEGTPGKMLMMGTDNFLPDRMDIAGRSDVEQRLGGSYVVQHEFMHFFFLRLWPEFNLEATDHAWFDRSTWPADFTGNWEGDYYANAVHRRFRNSPNQPAQALSRAANARQPIAQPIPGPSWDECATEGGMCSFSGTATVRFGALGRFQYFDVTNGTPCTAAALGNDPLPGVAKTCAFESTLPLAVDNPGGTFELCSYEGGMCSFSGTKIVRYGAPGQFQYFNVTNGTLCLNAAFGPDPAPGQAKTCALYTGVPVVTEAGGSFAQCATEGERCGFSGTDIVRYGSVDNFQYFTVTDGIVCTSAAFGQDPAPGEVKTCSLQVTYGPALVNDPGGYWAQCAAEGAECSFFGTKIVRYGAAPDQYQYFETTNSIVCSGAGFGVDPAPGLPKTCSLPSSFPETIGDPGGNWEQCATEGGSCSFSGKKVVRYGAAPDQFEYFGVIDGIVCSGLGFGVDPAPGLPKTCAVQSDFPPVVADPGGNWAQCAAEGGSCSFVGTQVVRYGAAPDQFEFFNVTDGVVCSAGALGVDPAPGLAKTCALQSDFPPVVGDPGGYWAQCAGEGAQCSFSGTQIVRYGAAPDQFEYFNVTDGVVCSGAGFGIDPAPGLLKTCSLQSEFPPVVDDPGGNWAQCAAEGAQCSFLGTQVVRYGAAPDQFQYFNVTDGVACSGAGFGIDPAPGLAKTCSLPSSAPPGANADCDDAITIVDALVIAQYDAGNRVDIGTCPLADPLTQINAAAADINGDGDTTIVDALIVSQCAVQIDNQWCPPAEP